MTIGSWMMAVSAPWLILSFGPIPNRNEKVHNYLMSVAHSGKSSKVLATKRLTQGTLMGSQVCTYSMPQAGETE